MFQFFDTGDLKNDEIALRLAETKPAQPEKGYVPAYLFDICLPDGTAVGRCDLRIGYSDKLYIGGHIGHTIDPLTAGGTMRPGLPAAVPAKKSTAWIICLSPAPDNIASARTCELAGGQFVEVADIPEGNEMYAEGKRQVRVYRFDL